VADRVFRSIVLLAAFALLPLALALALTLFPGAVQRALHGSDAFIQTCLAALYGLGQRLPPLGIVVAALALSTVGLGSARALALLMRTRALTRSCTPMPLPPRLASSAQRLGIVREIVLFDAPVAAAFTAGGAIRSRIFVSAGALAVLYADELEAVLLHERAHLIRGDAFRVAVARVLAGALFFLPLVDELRRRFEVGMELDADRAVITAQRGVSALASALARLGTAAPLRTQDVAVGAWSCASARIGQLEGRDPGALLSGPSRRASSITALGLVALFALASGQALRANIVPAAAWGASDAPMSANVHVCPVPLEGPLF
jgi:Zn-dependent protease with chaperone function